MKQHTQNHKKLVYLRVVSLSVILFMIKINKITTYLSPEINQT